MPFSRSNLLSTPLSSRHCLDLVERSAAIGIWALDLTTGRLVWSQGLHRLMGTDPAIFAPSLADVVARFHPDDRWIWEQARTAAGSTSLTVRVLLPGGGVNWHACHLERIGESEKVLVGIVQDVTENWTMRSIMGQRQRLVDGVIRLVGGMLWRADPTGSMSFDAGWCDFTGTTLAQNEGTGWLEVVHPADRSAANEAWTRAVSQRSVYATSYRIRRFDGIYRRHDARAVPNLSPTGEVLEWVGYCAPSDRLAHDNAEFTGPLDDLGRPNGRDLRAARALLNWSVGHLADASGVSAATIRRHESSTGSIRPLKLRRLKETLAAQGIELSRSTTGFPTLSYT